MSTRLWGLLLDGPIVCGETLWSTCSWNMLGWLVYIISNVQISRQWALVTYRDIIRLTKHIRQNLFALDPMWPSSSEALGLSHLTSSTGATRSTSLARDTSWMNTPFSRQMSSFFKGWNICSAVANKLCMQVSGVSAWTNNKMLAITHYLQHWSSRWKTDSSVWHSHFLAEQPVVHTTH